MDASSKQTPAESTDLGLEAANLLGFEWLELKSGEDSDAQQAVGLAFNKRGEGPKRPAFQDDQKA